MTPPTRLALLILIILLAGAGAAPAYAGTYQVYACEPGAEINRSWTPLVNHGGMTAYVRCANSDPWDEGLVARHALGQPHATVPEGSFAAMVFKAPPGATLQSITYSHKFCGYSGFTAGLANAAGTWLHAAGPQSCGTMVPPSWTLPLNYTPAVQLMTMCTDGPCRTDSKTNGYATMRSAKVTVADSTKPSLSITGGSAITGGWKRGLVDLAFRALDNVGVASLKVQSAGKVVADRPSLCDFTRAAPCPNRTDAVSIDTRLLQNGGHALSMTATDAAQNSSARAIFINVDNDPPGPPIDLTVIGGSEWRPRNSFAITWKNPQQSGVAPIAGVEYAVCPRRTPPSDWTGCTRGSHSALDAASLSGLTVPRAGEWNIRVWLRDAAGNERRENAQSVPLRLDNDAPTAMFRPVDSDDPTRIDILASDATSPLTRAEVEIQRRGGGRWLPIAVTRSASGFVSRLDDEHLADGTYELRGRVVDSAGNERSTTLDTSGRRASRSVPARINTRLVAGQIKHVKAKPSRGGKPRTRRVIVVRPTVKFGQTIPIRGRLTTPGANPVANASIEVWEQISVPGAPWRRVALIGTDQNGRFKFKALRGPGRVLRFRYPGSAIVRARTAEVEIQVMATTTFGTSRERVVNGEEIGLRGQVRGAPLPAIGKLVQLQAYSRGRWITFATPRAHPRTGRWEYRYRFTSTRGTVRYRFRARVPREAGFPYVAGTSLTRYVLVRGL